MCPHWRHVIPRAPISPLASRLYQPVGWSTLRTSGGHICDVTNWSIFEMAWEEGPFKDQGPHVQRLVWISYWNLASYAQINSDVSKCAYAWIQACFFYTSRSTWNWAHMQRWQTPPCPRPYLNMQIYVNRPWTWDSPLSDQIKQASGGTEDIYILLPLT